MTERKTIPFQGDKIFGPFPTGEAAVAVGMPRLIEMSKLHAIYWGDAGKSCYWSFQEIRPRHANGVLWRYSAPVKADPVIAEHGRINIYGYEGCFVAKDLYTGECYLSKKLRSIFEMAVSIVHSFPNDRVWPIPTNGKDHRLARGAQEMAGGGHVTSDEMVKVWGDGALQYSADRPVMVHLSDAIAILSGQSPSDLMMARLSDAFPQALFTAYGAAIIGFDKRTTRLRIGRSLSMFAMAAGCLTSEAIESFARDLTIGPYAIVGGWAFDDLVKHKDDRRTLAIINMALDTATSPASLYSLMATVQGVL